MWYNITMILNRYQKIKTRWQGLSPRHKTGVIFFGLPLVLGGLWWLGFGETAQAVEAKDAVVKAVSSEVTGGITGFVSGILMGIATFLCGWRFSS